MSHYDLVIWRRRHAMSSMFLRFAWALCKWQCIKLDRECSQLLAIKDLLYPSIARSSKWRSKLRWRLFAISLNDERQRTSIVFSLFYFQCYGRLLSFERIINVIGRNFLASHMLYTRLCGYERYRVDTSLCFNYVFDMTLYRIYSTRIVFSLRRNRLIENYNQLV